LLFILPPWSKAEVPRIIPLHLSTHTGHSQCFRPDKFGATGRLLLHFWQTVAKMLQTPS
jgi:hypothetical protein